MSELAWDWSLESQRNSDSDYWPYIQGIIFFFLINVQNPSMQMESFLNLKLLFDYQVNKMFRTLYSTSNPDVRGVGSRKESLAKPRTHVVLCTSEDP